MRFDTFDQVAKWYDMTKPLVSKNHTASHDVRPIGDRKRKWERILRVNENKYVLSDGNYAVWNAPTHAQATATQFSEDMGPIVWERREDGDYITITNHNVGHTSVTRYNFLYWHLPSTMRFHYNQSGKHFVRVNGEDYLLPKSNARVHYANGKFGEVVGEIQHLEFRAEPDGKFVRTGEVAKYTSTRIDKDLKKQLKPMIDKVMNDCVLYAPMLDLSWDSVDIYKKHIGDSDLGKKHGLGGWWKLSEMPTEYAREVFTTEDHELYIPTLALICREINIKHAKEGEGGKVRSAFNRLMNKVMGLYKQEEN